MKRLLFAAIALCVGALAVAQDYFFVYYNDGTPTQALAVNKVDGISPQPCLYGVANGHTWVDLGLPSGLRWATMNVGATFAMDRGEYFAWGETETKETYTWDNYKHGSNENSLTKYNTDYWCGTVDNLTTLEPEDDVASVKWGGKWRMPTADEWEELFYNCEWTRDRSIECFVGRSKSNGSTIYIPLAGFYNENGLRDTDYLGDYWSSSLYVPSYLVSKMHVFSVGEDDLMYHTDGCRRNYGLPVRPVLD